jgi:hypothetical protein
MHVVKSKALTWKRIEHLRCDFSKVIENILYKNLYIKYQIPRKVLSFFLKRLVYHAVIPTHLFRWNRDLSYSKYICFVRRQFWTSLAWIGTLEVYRHLSTLGFLDLGSSKRDSSLSPKLCFLIKNDVLSKRLSYFTGRFCGFEPEFKLIKQYRANFLVSRSTILILVNSNT